jgi:hypothetical protein
MASPRPPDQQITFKEPREKARPLFAKLTVILEKGCDLYILRRLKRVPLLPPSQPEQSVLAG